MISTSTSPQRNQLIERDRGGAVPHSIGLSSHERDSYAAEGASAGNALGSIRIGISIKYLRSCSKISRGKSASRPAMLNSTRSTQSWGCKQSDGTSWGLSLYFDPRLNLWVASEAYSMVEGVREVSVVIFPSDQVPIF